MTKRKRTRAAPGDLILKTVTVVGVKVDIKRRRGTPNLQLEALLTRDGQEERLRRSARTADLDRATRAANALALEVAKLLGVQIPKVAECLVARGADLTIGEVFDAYRELRCKYLTRETARAIITTMTYFSWAWGRDTRVADINQPLVDEFVAVRTRGISAPELSIRSAEGVALSTIHSQLCRLRTILNYVGGLRHEGRPVLAGNALAGICFPDPGPNVRRPVANARRYALYLEFEPLLYARLEREHTRLRIPIPRGMYRLLLVLTRETGHRIGAIRRLRFRHLLLMEEQVRSALAEAGGFHEEDWVESWPAGAIYWPPDTDKKKYARVTPVSRRVRSEIDQYIARYYNGNPDAYLFPDPWHPRRCLTAGLAWKWMGVLEEMIRDRGHSFPKLVLGQYHPFRRMWRSERSGAFDPKLIKMVGGWAVDSGSAMDDHYQWFSPVAAFLCVEFNPAVHRTAANLIPGVNVPGLAEDVLSTEQLDRELRALRGEEEAGANGVDQGYAAD
jgi:hypothetical protein